MSTIFDNPRLRQMDESLMRVVQSRCRNRVSNFFMIVMTYLGGGVIWCVWAGFLCGHPATRQLGICCYVSFWSAWLISSQILKRVFGRPRAYDAMQDVVPLVPRPKDLAFPSTHAADAFSVAVLLLLTRPAAEGCIAMLLAVLTAYSRIHVGVHYLTDVLGGAVFGSLCAVVCYLLLL
jgi:undecaprenyl-diphosphatase